MTPQDVLAELTALQDGDVPTHGGATMAYVYDSGRTDLEDLAAAAQAAFQWTNALDPTAFPSVARIENDLVGAALALLGGGPETVGTLTSGQVDPDRDGAVGSGDDVVAGVDLRRRGCAGDGHELVQPGAHHRVRQAGLEGLDALEQVELRRDDGMNGHAYSSGDSSSARLVARATRLVMPTPRSIRWLRSASLRPWDASMTWSVIPAAASAG